MELLVIPFILAISGALCSMLAAALSGYSYEEAPVETTRNPSLTNRLARFKANDELIENSIRMVGRALFLASAATTSAVVLASAGSWSVYVTAFVIDFLLIIFLEATLSATGHHWANKIVAPSSLMIIIVSSAGIPLCLAIDFIASRAGAGREEASLDELNAMVETAHDEGSLDAGEYRILKNIMRFSNVLVSDVMTPRTVVFSLRADQTVDEIINLAELQMYSRFPIWEGESLDDKVVGYVMSRDVLFAAVKGQSSQKLRNLARDLHFIPENAELDVALDSFLKKRQQIFLVVDEWGGIEGLLTMEDVMETILGAEIVDEADRVVDLRELAKQHRDRRIAQIARSHDNE